MAYGIRTCDLPACSIALQPTTLLRDPCTLAYSLEVIAIQWSTEHYWVNVRTHLTVT
jgi:hypothetical protein